MDPLSDALRQITAALDLIGIRYAIGGSLASSARSVWRGTNDIDVIAAIRPDQADVLAETLGPQWYADPEAMRAAIGRGRSFNLILIKSAQKVDIFPVTSAFHRTQLQRATTMSIGEGRVPCAVTTAEDILLAKLRWYADGGGVSDRQWNDICGIVAANTELDWEYLADWAARLEVQALLDRARTDARE